MSETTANENIKFLDSDVPDFGAEAAARAVRELGATKQLNVMVK